MFVIKGLEYSHIFERSKKNYASMMFRDRTSNSTYICSASFSDTPQTKLSYTKENGVI